MGTALGQVFSTVVAGRSARRPAACLNHDVGGDGERSVSEQDALRAALSQAPPPELVEALRRDPDALRAALRASAAPDLLDALRADPSPELRAAVNLAHVDDLLSGCTAFVAFVGYSRSGGSLVAALMDAHPELVVAHERDVFVHDDEGAVTARLADPDRETLVKRLLDHANGVRPERQGQRVRPDGSRYYSSYHVEGGWQGRYDRLRAVGTKNSVESAMVGHRFGAAPFLALQDQVGLPVRFVHVVRDPFDNIATMKRIHGDRSVLRYRNRAEGVAAIKAAGFEVLDVHLDDVIDDPARELRAICELFGVGAPDDYLVACAALVADRPSRTSASAAWTAGEVEAIEAIIEDHPWLHRYRDSGPARSQAVAMREALSQAKPVELVEALRSEPELLRSVLQGSSAPELLDELRREPPDELRWAVHREHLDQLLSTATAFVAFVGYPRSGGSIVGALMDAHPNLVVAHQHEVFEHLEDGEITPRLRYPDHHTLVRRLLEDANGVRTMRGGQRIRPDGTKYRSSYQVDGGWQGRCLELRAIGTKNPVESAVVGRRFGTEPLRALEEQAGLTIRFVHVVRNPYDNLATMRREHGDRSFTRYRDRAEGVAAIMAAGFPVLDLHLDDLIEDPRRELQAICDHYDVDAGAAYLDSCAAVVADRPSRTATTATWTPDERRTVEGIIDAFPWLHRYREAPG
jgi:hypothetical protein